MDQYKKLLQDILDKGTWKEPARLNMPKTKSLFGTSMRFNLNAGFPLLTTKKMYYHGIMVELLWFLKGDTNIKYLIDNGCNIWNQDAYRWYLKFTKTIEEPDYDYLVEDLNLNKVRVFTIEEFINNIKNEVGYCTTDGYRLGDLGKVYGEQWRNQNRVDQLYTCIERLKSDPMGRYAIIDAWNPSEFSEMALPPCHLLYQFNCREVDWGYKEHRLWELGEDVRPSEVEDRYKELNLEKYYLDLQMYQRSCDTFLGVPFNIASAALLLHIIAKTVKMLPGEFIWVGGDTHIYENHLPQVKEQLQRDPLNLGSLHIYKTLNSIKDIEELTPSDIVISNYTSHSAIKGELKTGL